MGSVSQENEAVEVCSCHIGHRKGIRVTSVSPRLRRMRRKAPTKYCNCAMQYPSLVESEHDIMSSIPTNAGFLFLNPLMLDLLQVKYQNKHVSPFQTHPANMWIFFVATCFHCLGLAFQMKIHNSGALPCRIFRNCVLFSGALSSISLASVFLPRLPGWICLSLWTILPLAAGIPLLLCVFKWVHSGVGGAMTHACKRLVEFLKSVNAQKLCLPK